LALPFGVITQATYATEETSVQGEQAHASDSANLLSYIPKWVDATPTILPEQSDQPIVPPTSETEDRTWIDRKQKDIRNWADRTSVKIDDWFGDVDPEKPASATIRVLVDNYWNKYDQYEVKPRIRGKIKLPTLEKNSVWFLVMTPLMMSLTTMLPIPTLNRIKILIKNLIQNKLETVMDQSHYVGQISPNDYHLIPMQISVFALVMMFIYV
jgi:hypothetical protein